MSWYRDIARISFTTPPWSASPSRHWAAGRRWTRLRASIPAVRDPAQTCQRAALGRFERQFGWTRSSRLPMRSTRSSTDRGGSCRSSALSLTNAVSIGLMSGLYAIEELSAMGCDRFASADDLVHRQIVEGRANLPCAETARVTRRPAETVPSRSSASDASRRNPFAVCRLDSVGNAARASLIRYLPLARWCIPLPSR